MPKISKSNAREELRSLAGSCSEMLREMKAHASQLPRIMVPVKGATISSDYETTKLEGAIHGNALAIKNLGGYLTAAKVIAQLGKVFEKHLLQKDRACEYYQEAYDLLDPNVENIKDETQVLAALRLLDALNEIVNQYMTEQNANDMLLTLSRKARRLSPINFRPMGLEDETKFMDSEAYDIASSICMCARDIDNDDNSLAAASIFSRLGKIFMDEIMKPEIAMEYYTCAIEILERSLKTITGDGGKLYAKSILEGIHGKVFDLLPDETERISKMLSKL